MHELHLTALLRTAFILAHVVAFAIAASAIAFADFAIFGRRRVDLALLSQATRYVTFALATLWLTGLAVIWLDTRFSMVMMMSNDKLLAKLTVVTMLTINGALLHRVGFPGLQHVQRNPGRAALVSSVLGAISGTTWVFAAFVGVGKAVAPLLGYRGFMALYLLALVVGIGVAMAVVRPRLSRRLTLTLPRLRSSASTARSPDSLPSRGGETGADMAVIKFTAQG